MRQDEPAMKSRNSSGCTLSDTRCWSETERIRASLRFNGNADKFAFKS
ncbi:hypothetical protein HMPREF9012_0234 [Bacteroidetes bacterium oral taxon 272 str. F0290]|nr:hypothetical protein HMPREF9012_0234 [Bacteroidetes bacterium oral taxon 272 str. F0290]